MKFEKWTLGLAAAGIVSLASATQTKADAAPAPNYVESATKGVSISGYVDTSVEYQAAPDANKFSPLDEIPFRNFTADSYETKRDGFNLNVIELNIEKDVDASPWSSGFKVSLIAGPDAVDYNPSANAQGGQFGGAGDTSDFAVKQAYVETVAPIGNGLDIKIGVFDTIIGYEVFEAGNNPNFTRSWGYSVEPTENTGILATYRFCDMVSASVGVANTLSPGIDTRDNYKGTASYWWKTVMGSITVTAPQSWGFLSGSSFYLGAVNGFNTASDFGANDQLNVYVGAVLNTPLKELTTGVAFDFVQYQTFGFNYDDLYNFGLYATYKATDKLSFNARGEYGWHDESTGDASDHFCWFGLTGTIEYDMWANVVTRAEVRYEEEDDFTGPFNSRDGVGLYLNVIYKF